MSHGPLTPQERILATIRRKHAKNQWRFDYNPSEERWETYRTPIDWPHGLYGWLWEFGNPVSDPAGEDNCVWDYHGGWIYFYDEKLVTAFMLRWA